METHDSPRDQVTTNQVDQVHIKVRHPETWWTFEPGSSSYFAQSKVSTTTKTTTPTATFNDKGAIESHYSPLRVDPRGGHLKRICKDAFSVAGVVQDTCSSELLGGLGADFLRGVAFWSLRSSGLGRWFCVTGAALGMTWHHFFVASAVVWTDGLEKAQNALVRGRQLCTKLSIFEWSLAELLRFWCCEVQKLRKCRNIAAFSSLQIDR